MAILLRQKVEFLKNKPIRQKQQPERMCRPGGVSDTYIRTCTHTTLHLSRSCYLGGLDDRSYPLYHGGGLRCVPCATRHGMYTRERA